MAACSDSEVMSGTLDLGHPIDKKLLSVINKNVN